MGLIKAAVGALGGTLADSWKEVIHCGLIDNSFILKTGVQKNDSKRSSNKNGTPGTISSGSLILVEENTCMLTVDNGKITNVVTEPGEYQFDDSSLPSIFAGDIDLAVKDAITRFTFGGTASSSQKAVYINLQPLPGIPFGTSTPVPYFDPKYNTTIELRFYGTFEIQILNAEMAVRFYQEVAQKGASGGDMMVLDIFKSMQYKNEFMQAMMQAMSMLSGNGISYNQIATNLSSLTENVRIATENNWKSRGFTVTNIGMGPVTISDESKELLKDRLKADTMLDTNVQNAMLRGSVARGIENAASNSGGAAVGFMGMNMATNMGGGILGQLPHQSETTNNSWQCACGKYNSGKFCSNCGSPPKVSNEWLCNCGVSNKGKFCSECGNPAPTEKKCSNCNSIISKNNTKFCPECGNKLI